MHDLIEILNAVVLACFLLLLGANLYSMLDRLHLYRVAKLDVPALLKRSIVLFSALAVLGGEAALLRVLGMTFADDSLERFLFLLQSNLVFLGALGYYTKVELFDVDDPDKS